MVCMETTFYFSENLVNSVCQLYCWKTKSQWSRENLYPLSRHGGGRYSQLIMGTYMEIFSQTEPQSKYLKENTELPKWLVLLWMFVVTADVSTCTECHNCAMKHITSRYQRKINWFQKDSHNHWTKSATVRCGFVSYEKYFLDYHV